MLSMKIFRTGISVLIITIIASVFQFGAVAASAQTARAALVGVDEVVQQPVSQTVPIIGRLVARRSGIVASRARGPVEDVKVEVGDRVQADEIVAVLVQDRLKHLQAQQVANLKQKQAELQTQNSLVKIAQQGIKRLERLRNSKSAAFRVALYEDNKLELLKLKSEVAEARAAISRAKINISLAELDLEYTLVRAPYPGVVTRVHTEAGAFLNVGSEVLSLVDDNALEIEADVPVERVAAVQIGAVINVTVAGQPLLATVRAQIPEENPLTRTRAIRFSADLSKIKLQLATNQAVSLAVPIGNAREVITVHKDAILKRKGESLVFVVEDGKAKSRAVQLGDGIGGRFEVLGGLTMGDVVVIRGNERLFPGQAVKHK